MVAFRFLIAVAYSYAPSIIFSTSVITTSIAACASMDFPLAEASNYPDRIILFHRNRYRGSKEAFHISQFCEEVQRYLY